MEERHFESSIGEVQRSARRMADAQEMAARASEFVSERARDVGQQVERLTGRSTDAWMRDARRFVQDHPLQAVVLTVGLGFVLGKILLRD